MTLTEEEAKTKWCPFARFAFPNGSSANRDDHPRCQEHTRCIASACMAWRNEHGDWSGKEPRGFCGLASSKETK